MTTQEEHGCFSGRSQPAEARPEQLCPHTRAQPGPAGDAGRLLAEEAEEPLPAQLSGPPRDTQRTSRPRDGGGRDGPARPRSWTYPAGAGVGGGAEQRAEQRQQRPRRAQRPARAARHGPGGARARVGTSGARSAPAPAPRLRLRGCPEGEGGRGTAKEEREREGGQRNPLLPVPVDPGLPRGECGRGSP